jgi:hypothetical protein
MFDAATFNETDWAALTPSDSEALVILARSVADFEPLARSPRVEQVTMDSLMAKGLAIEGALSIYGRRFKLTDKGRLAIEWLQGRRPRVYSSPM